MSALAHAVRLRGVSCEYAGHQALADVDLTLDPGERVALLGASGAGKSTLLGLLNGARRPDRGTVEVLGQDLGAATAAQLRDIQRRIGTVSQRLDLIEQVRVVHNVNAGRLGQWSVARALSSLVWPRGVTEVQAALDRVGIGWATYERTERLSGGERQRVALARVLVQRPDLVLADEPVSSLDPARAAEVLGLLTPAQRDTTLVVSLHQPELARRHCTRAVGLQRGRIVFDVAAADLDDAALARLYALT